MINMARPAEAKRGSGTRKLTAIDKVTEKITFDHGAIPAVGWPAMTIAFSATPEVLQGLSIADTVHFDVTVTGRSGTATNISED
jgi:Cu(I)/Ag(I) efflux system protein CusF